MANKDAPFGFQSVTSDAKGSTPKLRRYAIQAAEATDLFPGDPVILEGTSVTDKKSGKQIPTVVRATAGSSGYVTGVIVDFIPETDNSPRYKTDAVTQRFVLVCDDPEQLFEIQADEDIVAADIGNTADFIFTVAGDTVNGKSGCELDSSTVGTGDQLVIEGISQTPGRNELGSANTVALVRFNLHQKRNTTGV